MAYGQQWRIQDLPKGMGIIARAWSANLNGGLGMEPPHEKVRVRSPLKLKAFCPFS